MSRHAHKVISKIPEKTSQFLPECDGKDNRPWTLIKKIADKIGQKKDDSHAEVIP